MSFITDWFLVCWLRRGRYIWSKLRRRLFERRYLSAALPVADSLSDIETSLNKITWTKDGPLHLFDCISYPQTTWVKKKDDCDGFSMLAAELLNRWNPSCNPVLVTAIVRPVQYSHTVCVFTSPEGDLCYFDNQNLHSENHEKHENIINKIVKENHSLVCWDVRNPFTLDMVDFHKH